MAMDSRIQEAIYVTAREHGQSEELAERLVAWFEAVASGNENVQDQDSSFSRLDFLTDSTRVEDGAE